MAPANYTTLFRHGQITQLPSRFSLIFYYVPAIGKIPICPRTCCGPRHCQHVSEPVRRALIFGALWQHHGLHDYFFVQHRDQRGTMRIPSNTSEAVKRRPALVFRPKGFRNVVPFDHLSNLKNIKKICRNSK